MNARNFDKLMTEEIGRLGEKKRLLLHCCCAPCSSACLERLKEHFEITALFYNPNIEDEEYLRPHSFARYARKSNALFKRKDLQTMRKEFDLSRRDERESFIKSGKADGGIKNDRKG